MKPITVLVDVPQPRDRVSPPGGDAQPQRFTDHMPTELAVRGPRPRRRLERRVDQGRREDRLDLHRDGLERAARHDRRAQRRRRGRRRASGTYALEPLPTGGTRVNFEYAWREAPRSERLLSPLVRAVMRPPLQRSISASPSNSARATEERDDGESTGPADPLASLAPRQFAAPARLDAASSSTMGCASCSRSAPRRSTAARSASNALDTGARGRRDRAAALLARRLARERVLQRARAGRARALQTITLVAETHVPDDVWHEAEAQFGPDELAQVVLDVIAINAFNRLAITSRTPPGSYRP